MAVPGASGVTTVMAPDGYRSCARTGMPSMRVAATTAAPTGLSFMAPPPDRMPKMPAILFGIDPIRPATPPAPATPRRQPASAAAP
jgi:hypothetical protein